MKTIKVKILISGIRNRMKRNRFGYGYYSLSRFIFTLLFVAYHLLHATSVYGAFENMGRGARSISMGSAYTSISDDLNAIQYNPAGLAKLRRGEVTANYGKLYLGLTDRSNISNSYFAVAYPIQKWNLGTFGMSYSDLNLSGYYKEDAITFSFSKEILNNLLMGLSLKRLHKSAESDAYTAIDPTFQRYGQSLSAFGLDYGLLYHLGKRFSFGFAIKDFNRPDLGLAEEDRLPIEYRLGASYNRGSSIFSSDFIKKKGDLIYDFGAERWFFRDYALRVGLDFGSRNRRNLTTGIGYRFKDFQFDYSFVFSIAGIEETSGSHNFSLTLRFGKEHKKSEEIKNLEEKADEGEITQEDVRELLNEIKQLKQEVDAAIKEKDKFREELSEKRMAAINELLAESKKQQEQPKNEVSVSSTTVSSAEPVQNEVSVSSTTVLFTEPVKLDGSQIQVPASVSITTVTVVAPTAEKVKKWRFYIVKKGDTLRSIAEKVFGNKDHWIKIYNENPTRVERGGIVKPKTVLLIPPKE